MQTNAYFFLEDEIFVEMYECGNCHYRRVFKEHKFCPVCGQEITAFVEDYK